MKHNLLGSFVLTLFISGLHSSQVYIVPPERHVSMPGGNAVFNCINSGSESIQWLINGTEFEDLSLENVRQDFDYGNSFAGAISALTFSNISLDYNMTRVRCRLEGTSIVSPDSSIFLQGPPPPVGSLALTTLNTSIILSWTAPHALRIAGFNTETTYCVNVINFTSSESLHSECGINETEFQYAMLPSSWCHMYAFQVTPVNPAGEGEHTSISYPLKSSLLTEQFPPLILRSQSSLTGLLQSSLAMSAPVCHAELILLDLATEEEFVLEDTDVVITETNITFSIQQLRKNRHYNVTVTASNMAGSASSYTHLSTHDIVNATFEDNSVVVEYLPCSTATGALVHFIFIDDSGEDKGEVDFEKSEILILNRHSLTNNSLRLHSGFYEIYVYDIEESGTLEGEVNYPAVSTEITASEGFEDYTAPPPLLKCKATASIISITAECTYPIKGSTITGFQMLVQLNDIEHVQKIYTDQTVNQDTSASVLVEANGLYLVTIFSVRGGRGILDSTVEYREVLEVDNAIVETIPVLKIASYIRRIASITSGTVVVITLVGVPAFLILCAVWKAVKKKRSAEKKSFRTLLCEEIKRILLKLPWRGGNDSSG